VGPRFGFELVRLVDGYWDGEEWQLLFAVQESPIDRQDRVRLSMSNGQLMELRDDFTRILKDKKDWDEDCSPGETE